MGDIRVTIFEDNRHLRESLALIINGTPGFTCISAFPDCNDLVFQLMDIEMPGMRGTEAVKIIKREFPGVQVLMQTVFDDSDNIFQSVCAGASGYILKTTSPSAYLQAITDVYNGGSPMTGVIARKVLTLFGRFAPVQSGEDYKLTAKEKEVLAHLVQGKSFKLIAEALGISYETVRTHMKNIYSKLHVSCNTEAVSKVLKEGIL